MDAVHRHPVFFECPGPLGPKAKKAIETYFRVRRRSGGGECGPLTRLRDQTYCVAFTRQEDQQAVLQRSQHVVDGLHFTIRGSASPPSQDFTAPVESPQSITASTPPPSGNEHELPDPYLPRHREELTSVACSAQLDPEEGGVLVLSEKRTSVCRLGEAKLRLLWKEFEHSLLVDFPGVKVAMGAAGQLVLEGSAEEILKAGDWISDKESLVLERTVSDKSPHLLAFLRKAYGGPGVLGDFLGVGDKVEVELRDTVLRFFSLTIDDLDKTEKALRGEIMEVKIDIPNCSAVPSVLREKLKSKTNEMNQGKYRAQVVFSSDSTVFLLGHTKEVEELSETVTQFISDQSSVQTIVRLPFTELAQELPSLLQQHGFDCSGVTFHPLASSSGPMVMLGGPASKVAEVRNRLGSFLDLFLEDRVTIEPLETVRYSQGPTGTHNVAPLCLSDVNTTVATYSLRDGFQVLVCEGDITKLDADALVNAANEDLDHGGGVAAALSKAGGPEVQKESRALVKQIGKVPLGEVVVTTGGNLNCKKLLHAVGPVGGKSGGNEREILENTVQSALNLAEMLEFRSIAIPCISSGLFGVPVTVCSEAIVTAVKKFGSQGGRCLNRVTLIDKRGKVVRAMQEACDRLLQGISTENSAPRDLRSQRGAGAPDNGVHVEVILGTIETQQVDALVSPMVGADPLSTRIGNTLFEMVGPKLTASFRKKAGEETVPGDVVLVEDLPKLPSNAVFFLNLIPWDDDPDGCAVQVLRMALKNILSTCEKRGFRSVALPVLGSGFALRFPDAVVATVLMEEVHAFKQDQAGRASLLVRVAIHPHDEESSETFMSIQEAFQLTRDVPQPDQASTSRRIVLLGKTGSGKSSLANTIFGENLFATNHSPKSGTSKCQAETKSVNGKSITLIDTPGFFDAGRPEGELRPEIVRCITECAPGPHAFLIVLKVEKFTEQEEAVVTKICQYFSGDALRYAAVVFTHGDQLPKGTKIEEFVGQSERLSELVKKCGGRCHVLDNKYWKNKVQNNYRSNQVQVEDLLNTIGKMVMENNDGYYTNRVFQEVEKEIQIEGERMKQSTSSANMTVLEIRKQAKSTVSGKFWIRLAGIATGALLGAFFGMLHGFNVTSKGSEFDRLVKKVPALRGAAGDVMVGTTAGLTLTGVLMGGMIGQEAAEGAETPMEAAEKAACNVFNKGKAALNMH